MPFILNTSLSNVLKGHHRSAGANSMLIQICDPARLFPAPAQYFKEIHKFEFLDAERTQPELEEFWITQEQAEQLVSLLKHALENDMNVIVHCHAGKCRSGAVAEIGVMLGFEDGKADRTPNLLVKSRMMKVLGWAYDD